MLRPLAAALAVFSVAACGNPPSEGRQRALALEDNIALAGAFLQGTTIKVFSEYDVGTQFHYLAPNGRAFMVTPGASQVLQGRWNIQGQSIAGSLCMQYPTAQSKNLLVRGHFYQDWNCDVLSRQLVWFDEIYDGDVLGLARTTTLPRELPPRVDVPIATALREIGRPPLTQPNKAVAFD